MSKYWARYADKDFLTKEWAPLSTEKKKSLSKHLDMTAKSPRHKIEDTLDLTDALMDWEEGGKHLRADLKDEKMNKFSSGVKNVALLICKIADAPSSPVIDPKKAAAMQRGALSGGTGMSQAWSNLKSGLGFGAAAPQEAGTLSR